MTQLSEREVQGIVQHFEKLADPRSSINRKHLLTDVIVIAMCGVCAGADGPEAIVTWARTQVEWLRKYLALPSGLPSHDTVGRVLEALNPLAFQECFVCWLQSLMGSAEPAGEAGVNLQRQVAIDGKTLRRSHDQRRGLGPLHLVSAWATEQGITMGQLATEQKSNEITAIPQLIERLDLKDAVVTIDAAGCQKNIAAAIIAKEGDYLLALKGNHEKLYEAAQDLFEEHLEDDFARIPVSRFTETETSHGRTEQRFYYQITAPKTLPGYEQWKDLKTIGVAIRIAQIGDKEICDTRYFLSSLPREAKSFARYARGHWSIENTLHWSLDMTFREDESRVRGRKIADNLGWLRRIALTLIKQHPGKESLVMKRRLCGWDIDFLMQVLTGKAT